jgi:hypothetical protein
MSLLSVPIFYASKSPPPPLPLLTKQTEIRIPAAIVLAQEPIDPKQLDYVAPRPRLLLVKSRAQSRVTFDLKPLSQAPESTLGNLGYRSESAAPPEPREFVSEPPDAPLIENSPGSEPEAQSLIEKPRGSYGRPGAGGYNIDQAVTKHNISARDFEEIKVRVSMTTFRFSDDRILNLGICGGAGRLEAQDRPLLHETEHRGYKFYQGRRTNVSITRFYN